MSRNPYLDMPRYATVAEANAAYSSISTETGAPLAWIESLGGPCVYDTEEDVWVVTPTASSVVSAANPDDIYVFEDDFHNYVDADEWTLTASDSGTAAVGDDKNGVITTNASDGTAADNDESYLGSTRELVLIEANKSVEFKARVKLSEADTDKANIIVGLADAVAADLLQDDGDGPAADYDGFVFFKVDGGTVWQAETSNDTTQDTATDVGTFNDDTWTWLKIVIEAGATTAEARFYVDNVLGGTLSYTISGSELMHVVFGVKNGSANGESLEVDKVIVRQVR